LDWFASLLKNRLRPLTQVSLLQEGFMETVGAYEAKTHLAQILERVARGERITIARHGVPVAVLQPADSSKQMPVRTVIEHLRALRERHNLDGLSLRDLIEEGRS
jgi:prevent-host-death family protein